MKISYQKKKKNWYWILKFKGYRHLVQKVCKIWANFGNFYVKNVLKPYYGDKKIIIFKYKRCTSRFLKWTRTPYLKLKKWKRSLSTYLEKQNCRKLSEVSRFCAKSHKGFGKKDYVKNACDRVATTLEFINIGNYF